MKKPPKTSIVISGIVFGCFIAGYFFGHKNSSDRSMEVSAMQAAAHTIVSLKTLEKLESSAVESIKHDHITVLRGSFLTLVELHRSDLKLEKEEFIRKQLKRANKFMQNHPNDFLNQKLFSYDTTGESVEITEAQQKILQSAYDYVDSLE